jgi:sarcosine oxidase subunit alpha
VPSSARWYFRATIAPALKTYLARYAVRVGERLVIFTNNDSAYDTARAHLQSGGTIAAIVDTRKVLKIELYTWVSEQHLPLYAGAQIVGTKGRGGLHQVHIRQADGHLTEIDADALGMSGGFNPTVQLFSQSGGQLKWDSPLALFKPDVSSQNEISVGACCGHFDLQASLPLAYHAGAAAAAAAGYRLESECAVPQAQTNHGVVSAVEPVWRIAGEGKAFVDFQNDVTADDVVLAARENYASVEHLKRYTTLGMAPDQGKTSNVNGLALLGEITGRSPSETGTTRFRFPFAPISMGALAGRARSTLYRPMRHLACHAQHAAAGAVFDDYGGWQRPAHYLRGGESPLTAQNREALAVRTTVGIFDGSPLGKFVVKGPSAQAFLDRVYANTMSTLAIGHLRYGMMLNEFGVIVDDGVTARLGRDEFCVGTSSGGAAKIGNWLEQCLQCEWPQYDVLISPITAAWSVITLSGPRAREVLSALDINFSVASADFPHMTLRDGKIADVQVRVMRVSFTGEVSFEINVANYSAPAVWDQLMAAGASHSITPIGIDAWDALRIEKGYLHIGSDTDGTTTPPDVGWAHVLKRDIDFVGRRSLMRPENVRADRFQTVAFESLSGVPLNVGSHVLSKPVNKSQGYITSCVFSHTLNRWLALGMLRSGRARLGETVSILTPQGAVLATIVPPNAYDARGARLSA